MTANILDSKSLTLSPIDNRRLADLCGQFDQHLRQIEEELGVKILNRSNHFQIEGPKASVIRAFEVLQHLYHETEQQDNIDNNKVHLYVQSSSHKSKEGPKVQTPQLLISQHSPNQALYLKRISDKVINFGIGPAGTGKTYLAVAAGVAALEAGEAQRLILVRPAVEAGERLGFLPGDMVQKVDPYLRPLYDALYEMLGNDRTNKLIEKNVIEMAPLAYMRGRTLNDAFIILDESQNTTKEQMKMFLTRLGFSSKAVITGDITQIDLPKSDQSGLLHAISVLQSIPTIAFTYLTSRDIVRHPVVQQIVEAYEKAGE